MKNVILIIISSLLLANTGICGQPLTEKQIVALTILGEARGEGKAGMYAVACVVVQRCIDLKQTPKTVCLKNRRVNGVVVWQFSCWACGVNPQLLNTQQGTYALGLATNLYRLNRAYVKFADHFCHITINNYWTKGRKPVAIIGNHKFYKLRP